MSQSFKKRWRQVLAGAALVALTASVWWQFHPRGEATSLSSRNAGEPSYFVTQVQPILEKRCVACHGCYGAPCQLKMESPEGLARGAFKTDVNITRMFMSGETTRLGIDAHSTREWRNKGFFDVVSNGLMAGYLEMKAVNPDVFNTVRPDLAPRFCASDANEFNYFRATHPEAGMPYGLVPIPQGELAILKRWMAMGAPLRDTDMRLAAAKPLTSSEKEQLKSWDDFFNAQGDLRDAKQSLVSRYIYEHLFLATIYFGDSPDHFFRLVRSRTPCEAGINEIPTRRPNDDPGVRRPYYCLKLIDYALVEKNNTPYQLSPKKMERFRQLFFGSQWTVRTTPSYRVEHAANPFLVFQDIPAEARYRFLLDDARYHVSTFIKGPVCYGTAAVNSIDEQFYVFFLNPDADPFISRSHGASPDEFARQAIPELSMPGEYGVDIEPASIPFSWVGLMNKRNTYRDLRFAYGARLRPRGYTLKDVWDGEGSNPNAVLTVLRHDDSAYVLHGARGDLSRTVAMVDYGIFERLCYNLVVNWDSYSNTGYQLMTRIYMGMLRMDWEELFLQFLPSSERSRIRSEWYQGPLTTLKIATFYPQVGLDHQTGVSFRAPAQAKAELVGKILFERLGDKVRGEVDRLNWRRTGAEQARSRVLQPEEKVLRSLSGTRVKEALYPSFFPDFSLLLVTDEKGEPARLYSIVHNKEMASLAWIFLDSARRNYKEDSLMVFEGVAGSYPNSMFRVKQSQLASFAAAIREMRDNSDWTNLLIRYGVLRSEPKFWKIYDDIQSLMPRYLGPESGILDLTRFY